MKYLGSIFYEVPPAKLTQVERERLADVLSGYAADLRKGAEYGPHVNVRLYIAEGANEWAGLSGYALT